MLVERDGASVGTVTPPAAAAAVGLLSAAAARARENERQRLSRELHDGVGAGLAGIILVVGAARDRVAPGARQLLAGVERDLVELARELRLVIDDLRPPALDELGLIGALRRHAGRLEAAYDQRITLRADDAVEVSPLPARVQLAAYRIATEALTNAARHAGGTYCHVVLARDECALQITVCDDGIGLPAASGCGVGLGAMRERARELGGRCEWHTDPGPGTRMYCRLPLAPR